MRGDVGPHCACGVMAPGAALGGGRKQMKDVVFHTNNMVLHMNDMVSRMNNMVLHMNDMMQTFYETYERNT